MSDHAWARFWANGAEEIREALQPTYGGDGAIRIRARGSFTEARKALARVAGVIELVKDGADVVIVVAAFSPAEEAVKLWLRGGEDPRPARWGKSG